MALAKSCRPPRSCSRNAKTRAIDLAVDEESHESFVPEAGCEREFALSDVERSFGITQSLVVEPRHVFERRVAHSGVVSPRSGRQH